MKNIRLTKRITTAGTACLTVGLTVIFTACSGSASNEEKGREAAIEFCDCIKKNSESKCFENLKDKYSSSVYLNDDFIDSFNKANTCNIVLYKESVKSKSLGTENKQDGSFLIIK